MIDFHCHIDLYPNPDQIIRVCHERELFVLSVTTTPSAWDVTNSLASGKIKTALGLHPQLVHLRKTEYRLFEELLPKTRYVGEIGLDGAEEYRAHWNDQYVVFTSILKACTRVGGRIMSIHSRFASKAVLDCLETHRSAGTPVLHWFTGNSKNLDRAIDLGCWFSVGPSMLMSDKGRGLTARMPRERILTETDGPFAHIDGRSVLPWDVESAIKLLTNVWEIPRHGVIETLNSNLRRITQFENPV